MALSKKNPIDSDQENNLITNNNEEQKTPIENEQKPKSSEEFVEVKEKMRLPFWKTFFTWLYLWSMLRKAKKMAKKMKSDPNYYSEEYRYHWMKKKSKYLVWLFNVKIQVVDIENWLDKGIVLAPNHQSNFDPILFFAVNDFQKQQPIAFIAKQEIWKSKIFGRFVNIVDAIPLDRNNPRSALAAVKEAKDLISEYKRSMIIFPEGTRSGGQQIGEFKAAALKVAQMAYAPVVPVTLINSYQVFSKNRPKKVIVKIIFGKPIMPEKHINIKSEMLTEVVRREVVKNMEKYEHKDLTPAKVTKKRKKK